MTVLRAILGFLIVSGVGGAALILMSIATGWLAGWDETSGFRRPPVSENLQRFIAEEVKRARAICEAAPWN